MKEQITKVVVRAGMQIKKYSPEVLMVTGVASIVGGTIIACKATLKAEGVMYEHQKKLEEVEDAVDMGMEEKIDYTPEDAAKDKTILSVQTGVKLAKVYAPGAGLVVFGLACILSSHGIMRKRNVALLGAYKMAEETFANYRNRVREELGEEKDRHFRYGTKLETIDDITFDEKTGKDKTMKKKVEVMDPNGLSQYARFFDESCPDWNKEASYNFHFLKCQQSYMNDKLHANGHVFLNEVYDSIGVPRTPEGQLVGWVLGKGDDFIDFGLFDREKQQVRDFVNGYERSILLDFNVAGVVYDLI